MLLWVVGPATLPADAQIVTIRVSVHLRPSWYCASHCWVPGTPSIALTNKEGDCQADASAISRFVAIAFLVGAGRRNRTHIPGVEGRCSTIELHPLGCWRIRADKKLQPLGLRRYGAPSSYASQCAPFHLPRCVLRIHQQSLTPGMSSRPSGPAQEAKLCWSSALTRRRLGRFKTVSRGCALRSA